MCIFTKLLYRILSSIMCNTSIVRTWISQWFLAKKNFNDKFKRNNHCKFIHHNSYLKPFLRYPHCIVRREYFSIIFNVKKCTLYLIKYCKYGFTKVLKIVGYEFGKQFFLNFLKKHSLKECLANPNFRKKLCYEESYEKISIKKFC